jgi:hypothetical protein
MIDKQTLLNSFDQAIEQSLTALNADLTALMQDRVNQVIQAELESGLLNNRVERGIANFLSVMVDDSHKQLLLSRITQNTDQFVETTFANTLADTQQMINDRAVEIVKGIVSTLDFSAVIRQAIHTVLSDHRYVSNWPAKSIQPHLIDFDNAQISASVLNGGIARNFASSGIADFATSTVLTVLNDRITLKGNLRVNIGFLSRPRPRHNNEHKGKHERNHTQLQQPPLLPQKESPQRYIFKYPKPPRFAYPRARRTI